MVKTAVKFFILKTKEGIFKMSNNFPPVDQIFRDLDAYRNWCRFEGKCYNEKDLYNERSQLWSQYKRYQHYLTKIKNRK